MTKPKLTPSWERFLRFLNYDLPYEKYHQIITGNDGNFDPAAFCRELSKHFKAPVLKKKPKVSE